MAKLFKIKVEEFSIGFGPRIFTKQGKETQYSVSLIPFGGYVRMLGEEERSDDPRSFNKSNLWKRKMLVLAGPRANICFALIVYFVLILSNGMVVTTDIASILPNASESVKSSLMVGDRIIQINGEKVKSRQDMSKALLFNDGQEVEIMVMRDGEKKVFHVTPIDYDGVYILGLEMTVKDNPTISEKITYAGNETSEFFTSIGESLKMLVTGKVGMEQMTGPVGISKMVVETNGLYNFIYLLALVSLSLGVTNLLPIPALDGGRLLILIVEGIRKKPLPEEMEYKLISLGFTFIILLSIYVTYNDIFKIFEK